MLGSDRTADTALAEWLRESTIELWPGEK